MKYPEGHKTVHQGPEKLRTEFRRTMYVHLESSIKPLSMFSLDIIRQQTGGKD
jgi:hypothetical protein